MTPAVQLPTHAIPQADVLWDVVQVPIAVRAGATTPEALAVALGAKVRRQAVYYTQAAQILGLIAERSFDGPLELTPYGRAFVRYTYHGQHRALRHLLLRTEPMRSVVHALIDHDGQNLDELGTLLQGMAPLAASTARRRARTIVSWLCDLDLARWERTVVVYCGPQLATYALSRTSLPSEPQPRA